MEPPLSNVPVLQVSPEATYLVIFYPHHTLQNILQGEETAVCGAGGNSQSIWEIKLP